MKALSLMLAIVASAIVLLVAAPARACNDGGGAFSFTQSFSQPVYSQQFVQTYSAPIVQRQFVQRAYVQPFRQRVIVRERLVRPYRGGLNIRVGGW